MFCWMEEGAVDAALFQTLITRCVLAGIDPYHHRVDVRQHVNLHPARDIRELIARLWREKFGANPLTADLGRVGGSCLNTYLMPVMKSIQSR